MPRIDGLRIFCQNYHVQLTPPYNTVVIGGAKQLIVHDPRRYISSDEEDKQLSDVPEFFESWGSSDVVGWLGKDELSRDVDDGGCWTGGRIHSKLESMKDRAD